MSVQGTTSAHVIFFQSPEALVQALQPLDLDEVTQRISLSKIPLKFECDATLAQRKVLPLRRGPVGNLLETEVFKGKTLTVFFPETPRVPHHLAIALERFDIRGVASVSKEENAELFATIKKITEIYQVKQIQGFVVAQFDTPQEGHLNRYVIEVIPHLPGFGGIKHTVDKVGCNRQVLFRSANLSPLTYGITRDEVLEQVDFWKLAFQQEHEPVDEASTRLTFPYSRHESYQLEAEKVLYRHLIELLEDRGGVVKEEIFFEEKISIEVPETVKAVTSAICAFCEPTIVERQLVYRHNGVSVFYNMRKSPKAGSAFLILPNRHTEKVYNLTQEEIDDIFIVRRALVEVLKDAHPECEVVIYTQDSPAVGQTVFHSHEQVVAIDPKTIALTWTMASLCPSGCVLDEEMRRIREEFSLKLEAKIQGTFILEKAAS
ncbi:MAG: HIT domain-containing protein [Chlamydiales bacterium]|nr:HIT domain-containing protein [Chlamydiales bacterium]